MRDPERDRCRRRERALGIYVWPRQLPRTVTHADDLDRLGAPDPWPPPEGVA